MVVLNEICEKCNKICYAICYQRNFKNWTSGNNDIDKFIQDTQLSRCILDKPLEWIPYDRFYDIKYIAKGRFGKMYRANWIDEMFVILKSLNNLTNVTSEFVNEV